MEEQFRFIAQTYCGMTPKDKGCKNWEEMHEKMVKELSLIVFDEMIELISKYDEPDLCVLTSRALSNN